MCAHYDFVVSDEQQIRDLIDEWKRATIAGDLERVLSLMTDDVVFLTPGREPMNKEGFAAGFRAWSGKMKLDSKHDIKEVHVSGDLAYCWSHISIVTTSLSDNKKGQRAGYTLTIFRKIDGRWLLSRDANLIVA